MRKAQGKNLARPGSGMLEVVSVGSERTGDSDVAVSTPQGSNRPVSSTPGTPKKTVNLLAVKRKDESASSDLTAIAIATTIEADEFRSTTAAVRNKSLETQSAVVSSVRTDGVMSSSSSDSSEDVDTEGDDDLHKAPNEMKLEFLDCVMKKDYQTAAKLCKMILIYEPSNQDALSFQSLIKEKIEQDAVDASAGGSSTESDSSDSQDDSDGDEDEDGDETSTEDDEEQSDDEDSDSSEGEDSSENEEGSSAEPKGRHANSTAANCNGTALKKR